MDINVTNIEPVLKIIVGIIGAIVTLSKLRESFASIRKKQELKLDLEILEKIKDNPNIDKAEIEEKINKRLLGTFADKSDSLTNFFTGIAVFIGFGFWSINIYQQSVNFNGWIILTLLCSLIGLSLTIENKVNTNEKKLFYQLGFYDRDNFRLGMIITLLSGIMFFIIWNFFGLSFWLFLSGLFFMLGLLSIIRNIKRIN